MSRSRYHCHEPDLATVRVILAYKNFAANQNISHIGLGVAALNTCQVLRQKGIWADVWPILNVKDLEARIAAADAQATARGEIFISHVVISAPWIPTLDLAQLARRWPNVTFAVITHSNVAFLHADPTGMRLLREAMGLQLQWHNFKLGSNGEKFAEWALRGYGATLAYLPNLYNLEPTKDHPPRPPYRGGVLRIGSFGALRVLKNHVTACAAALEIGRRLGVDTEFWLSSGRQEGGAGVIGTIQQMVAGVPAFSLKYNNWQNWPEFRATLRSMNVLIQASFTESFNMVTADGVAEGVPSVTSDAIEWVPGYWQAQADNAMDIANKAIGLLFDPQAAFEGKKALATHNRNGIDSWIKFLMHHD